MGEWMLKNYRGRFPFKLATTSYIYPDEVVPNVEKLGPFFDEIELVLFESQRSDSIPGPAVIGRLVELSKLHQTGFNIHLPLDVSLGDERKDVRTYGTSIMKTVMERTLPLNPSVYTLHLDFINSPAPPFRSGGKGGFLQDMDIEVRKLHLNGSLKEILDSGMEPGRIAVETLAYPFEWIAGMVNQFGLSICLDTGHILANGYDLRHYLETYLPRTSIIHLHGFHNGSDHLGIDTLPESDFNLIVSTLHHYHGIVSIEVFSLDELMRSLSILEEKWTEH